MKTIKSKRRYSKDLKIEIVQLVNRRDGQATSVANNLSIHPNMLHRWIKEFEDDQNHLF